MSDTQAIAARLTAIAGELTVALLGAWMRHPSTLPGETGTPADVYFSVEKAVAVLAPVVSAHVETLTQQVAELTEGMTAANALVVEIRTALWGAGIRWEPSEGRTLVSMVKCLAMKLDEARDNRRGEFELREQAEQQRDAAHAALRKIRDEDAANCQCQYDDDNCCVLNGGGCAFCTADAALAASAPQKESV